MTGDTGSYLSKKTVAVVTGANKGIGYEVVKGVAKGGLTVVLTARDVSKGKSAVDALKAEGLDSIYFHELDVNSPESVQALASWLKSQFGGFDVLINNAGVNPTGLVNYEKAKFVIGTNYYGVKAVTEGLLPVLRPGGRVINTASRLGIYTRVQSKILIETFKDEEKYTKELFDSLATKYLEDVKAGKYDEEGWEWVPNLHVKAPMYSESKILLGGYGVALAKEQQIPVVTYCPGATLTGMLEDTIADGWVAPEGFNIKTPADGADTAVWLALLPVNEVAPKSGKFFAERTEYPFGWDPPPM